MGTYLILHSTTMKVNGHKVQVRPYSFSHHRRHLSPTPELPGAREKTRRSTSPHTNVAARVAVHNTPVEVNLAVPSASPEVEVAITTTTVELRVEPRVHVSTTSGESKVGIQQETIKSGPPLPRTTCPLPCPESRAATPSPALQHGSWGSFTTPGSRKNSTRRTRSTRSTSSSTQSSASHHSKGQQQGTGRVLQFFLKVFCCWPSPSIHEERHKRAKVHPRFCLQFCRVKIGPH